MLLKAEKETEATTSRTGASGVACWALRMEAGERGEDRRGWRQQEVEVAPPAGDLTARELLQRLRGEHEVVGAGVGEREHAAGDRGRGAAGGTARGAGRVPGVEGVAEAGVLGDGDRAELGRVGASAEDEAGGEPGVGLAGRRPCATSGAAGRELLASSEHGRALRLCPPTSLGPLRLRCRFRRPSFVAGTSTRIFDDQEAPREFPRHRNREPPERA